MRLLRTQSAVRRSGQAALLVVVLAGLIALGCGIDFGEASEETEVFKDVSIEGPFIAGEPITLSVEIAQQYPVDLLIRCDLLTMEDVPTVTPTVTETLSALAPRRTPEPTLARIPRVRPTPVNKLMEVLGTTVQPNAQGGPVGEATPVLETLERRFLAPEPGDYTIWCYTPADLNNGIFQDFSVAE